MTTPKKKIDLKINTGEYVTPVTRASNVIFKNGKTAQEILNDTDDNISDIISNSNSSFKIGCGDDADYSENVVDGAYDTIVLKGKSAVNLIKDDLSSSELTINGNDVFKTNEGMDEYTNILDEQPLDELKITGNSTYNIMPDRTCCTDDVEVSGDNTKAFSFKDGLDNRIMLDTGLSDKMVLKGNTLTNIVRDPVGYASVHEVQENIVPGSSVNVRILKNLVYSNSITKHTVSETSTNSNTAIFNCGTKTDLKYNTKYTIIMDVLENTLDSTASSNGPIKIQIGYTDSKFLNIAAGFTGRYVNTLTTHTSFNTSIQVVIRTGNTIGTKFSFKNLMIIEGDCTDIAANLPYFKGTLSVNMEEYSESRPKLITGDCDRTKIYGQTLVDVLGSNRRQLSKDFTTSDVNGRRIYVVGDWTTDSISVKNVSILKPNTDYIIRFKISNLNLDGLTNLNLLIGWEDSTQKIITDETKNALVNSNGIYSIKIRTVNSFETSSLCFTIKGSDDQWETSGSTARTLTISEVSMYEYQEGMENWDLPYMVGEMRGTGFAKIESIVNDGDKELVDVIGETRSELSKTFIPSNRAIGIATTTNMNLKIDTDYIIRFKISNLNLDGLSSIQLLIGYNNSQSNHFNLIDSRITTNGIYTFKLHTISDLSNANSYFNIKGQANEWENSTSTSRTLTISEISLYEYTPDMDNMELPYMLGTKRIGYYGERKRTYTLPSGLELRSLPNGVRDEFDFESGILTKRIQEAIITNNFTDVTTKDWYWSYSPGNSNNNYALAYIFINGRKAGSDNSLISNDLPIYNSIDDIKNTSGIWIEKISNGNNSSAIYLSIPKSKFTESEITSDIFRNYMKNNPITIQYELATPQYIDYSKDILEDGEYKVGERINGFQDGYNPTTGKYIKRVDKVVLDGTQSSWMDLKIQDDDTCLRYYVSYNGILCTNDNEINIKITDNRFKVTNRTAVLNTTYYTFKSYILIGRDGNYNSTITLNIPKSLLFENSHKGITDYLKRNPITLYYVLANEVESDMTQDEFNALTNRANPKLHYFKDGSLKCTCLSGQPKGQLRINTPTQNYFDLQLAKPNTQYTVHNFANMYINGTKYQTSSVTPDQLTLPNTITSKKVIINLPSDSNGLYPMMVECVHDKNDIRFFGMNSSTVLMNTKGKNLFNKDAMIEGKYCDCDINNNMWGIANNANYKITEFIPIKPNTAYKRFGLTSGAYYDINKNIIKTTTIMLTTNTSTGIFTTPSNARYAVFNLNISSDLSNAYIYEASESDFTYEPYAQPHEFKAFVKDANGILQAAELNHINDDLCDEIDLSTGVITRRVGKILLDGNNTSWNRTRNDNLTSLFFRSITNANKDETVLCDKFKSVTGSFTDGEESIRISSETRIYLNIDNTKAMTVDELKKYLSKNNITVKYALLEPYTEQAYILMDGEFKTSLMLPNGVADGYNPITKVKTTRVGVRTYDGNYDGEYILSAERGIANEVSLGNIDDATIGSIYNHYSPQLVCATSQVQMNRITMASKTVIVTLPKEKIGINKASLVQYLSTNPITLYYQKSEEITEPLDTFDTSTVVNNFQLANQYGHKVENTNEIKLSKVIHHLPTKNMLYVPLLQPSTTYRTLNIGYGLIIDNQVVQGLNNLFTTPNTINNKKAILYNATFNPSMHSLIKYTGYTPNLSRQYSGYMRSDAISSSKNPKVKAISKNLFRMPTSDQMSLYQATSFSLSSNSITVAIETSLNSYSFPLCGFMADQDMLNLFNKLAGKTVTSSCTIQNSNSDAISAFEIKINNKALGHIISNTNIYKTFTIPNEKITSVHFRFIAVYGAGTNNILNTATFSNIQLEVNDTNTTYETNKTHSINEFRIQKALSVTSGSIDPSGNEIESADMSRTDFIKVIPGLMYYLYNNTTQKVFNIVKYDNNKTCLGKDTDNGTCRYLVPSSVSYIRVVTSTLDSNNLILKADLSLYKINDDIYDSIDVKTNKLTRRVGRLTDLWKYSLILSINSNVGIPYFRFPSISNKPYDTGSALLLCNTLNPNSSISDFYYVIKNIGNTIECRMGPEVKTVEQAQEWFRQHPTDILYPLETYETFDLSEYTDIVNTMPIVYKEGTIQLDSSSETFPIINYRTKAKGYYEFYNNAGNYRILANINKDNYPCSIKINNSNSEGYKGDSVFTLPEGINSVSFSDPDIKNVIVMEDNIKGNIPCYFKGICDVKAPIITNHKKNLFDWRSIEGINGNKLGTYLYGRKIKPFYVEEGKNYVLITKGTCSSSTDYSAIYFFDDSKNFVYDKSYLIMGTGYSKEFNNNENRRILTPKKSGLITKVIVHGSAADTYYNIEKFGLFEADNVDDVEYEEYISNETVIDHDTEGNIIHLRSLPNGIYDELDLETGKLTQRIDEVIITGDSIKRLSIDSTSGYRFDCTTLLKQFKSNAWWGNNKEILYSYHNDIEGIRIWGKTPVIYPKNTNITLDEIKSKLNDNPVTLQYELAEPIIKYVNISDYPFAYENGNIILSSNTDEPSLTPTVEYSVPFNRNGQISMNSKLVTRQQKQIDTLEAIIIANLVETQYRQSLTAINYSLDE